MLPGSLIRASGELHRQAGEIFPKLPDMKTSIPPLLVTFALVCFALIQNTQAVSPAPDGGCPGGNTAEGQNALLGLTAGTYNTAVGFLSLGSNATNSLNTAISVAAGLNLTTGNSNICIGSGVVGVAVSPLE
jgi:hypothetical protein